MKSCEEGVRETFIDWLGIRGGTRWEDLWGVSRVGVLGLENGGQNSG